jgi:hypothetical protein
MNDIFNEPMLSIELYFIDPNRLHSYEIADEARTIVGERDNCDVETIKKILEEENCLNYEDDDLSDYESIDSDESEDNTDEFLNIFANLLEINFDESEKEEEEEIEVQKEKEYFGIGGNLDPTQTPFILDQSKLLDIQKDIEYGTSGVFLKQNSIPIGTKIGYFEGNYSKEKNDSTIYIKQYDIFVTADKDKWTSFLRNDDTHYNVILTNSGSLITVTEISAPSELIYSSFPNSLT